MTQHAESEVAEMRSVVADVPLSERPLIADGENTVISVPEGKRNELNSEQQPVTDALRQRLFPSGGSISGEEAGVRLAHYEIRERLGSGGMGAVFRANDLELARDIALKILNPGSSEDSSLVARFRNEARACAQLNHDNIARVYFAGYQDGLHFIAYELAEGKTIKDLIHESGQMTPAETVNYAIQVTLALNHIAAAGIVHRDIKPSNIMLTPTGRVKVVDLGLARRDTTDSIGDITVAGTTLGTFDYIAPEQARDPRSADIRSDIYSLGCTMYHMLTGQPPYPEGTALQKLLDHQGKSPPNPCLVNANISADLAAVMKKMMASNPELRYQAPALLLSDLLHLAQTMGLQSIPAEGIVWRKADAQVHRQPMGAIWVFASVVAICLTAIVLERLPHGTRGSSVRVAESGAEFDATPVDDFAESDSIPGSSADIASPPAADTAAAATVPELTADGASVNALGQSITRSSLNMSVNATALESIASVARDHGLHLAAGAGAAATAAGRDSAAADPSSVFVLQKEDGTNLAFQTLRGAIADARSGDVILLKYNGHPPDLVAQPAVRISMMNLIIRAAEGFRPTLEFDGSGTGVVSRTEMFTLRNGGTLTIRDVDLRMVMRDSVATDRWSMFRIDGPNRIHLENVTLDCRNPSGLTGCVFDFIDPASATEDTSTTETSVTLNRVTCRGQMHGFRIAGQPQGRIGLQNSAFGLTGSLIQNIGSSSMLQTRGHMKVSMEHVSTILTDSLIVMQDSDEADGRGPQRVLPTLAVTSDACVFASAATQAPLVFSSGNAYLEDIQSALSWTGFSNLYGGYATLWQIDTADMDFNDSRRMDMSQWKQLWQNRADGEESNGSVVGTEELPWRDVSWIGASQFQPSTLNELSFQLDPIMFTANGGRFPLARDGQPSGVVATALPAFPATPGPETSPSAPISGQSASTSPAASQESATVASGEATAGTPATEVPSFGTAVQTMPPTDNDPPSSDPNDRTLSNGSGRSVRESGSVASPDP